jgi:SAM-dependent methyltransferase
MLRLLYRWLDTPSGYRFTQFFGFTTIRRYRTLIATHVPQGPERRVLEIGCGLGASRDLFAGDYTGIDINPEYIAWTCRRHGGSFAVMDAGRIAFAADAFDDAVSIATAHHLSDDQLASLVGNAVQVASGFHLIDAILPISPKHRFKAAFFRMDRGQYVRSFDQLRDIVGRNGHIEFCETLEGPLHDVCYIRVARAGDREG